ncbi:hypothetical protein ABKN59_005043 [Abortiporus biennis]
MDLSFQVLLYIIGISLAWILGVQKLKRQSRLPLPSGPKPLPIVSNLFNVPASESHKTFSQWSKIYNLEMIFLSLPSQPTLIINSARIAFDLLEKRSHIYSN